MAGCRIRFVQMEDHSLIRQWPVYRLKENFAFALAKCFFKCFLLFPSRDRIPHDWEDLQSSYKRCRSVFLQASRLEKRKIKRPRAHLLLPFDTFSVLLTRRFARETNCRIDRMAMFRSIETHATRFILPFFLSLFSHFAYFLPFPPNHSLSINIPNKDDRFYSLNVRHVTNSILPSTLGITICLFRFFSPFSRF